MSFRFTARRSRPSPAAGSALDAGLEVRVEAHVAQRPIFAGAESLSASQLGSELAELVSSLRVRSFALRARLEEATTALLRNLECGSLRYARCAALDLAGLLGQARRRRLAEAELSVRGAHAALRVAELCEREAR
jgi:hypothetical protein